MIRMNILGTQLNHTGASRLCGSQNGTKIEIMGKDYEFVDLCIGHDLSVRRVHGPNVGPVNRLMTGLSQQVYPFGWKIHVDQVSS